MSNARALLATAAAELGDARLVAEHLYLLGASGLPIDSQTAAQLLGCTSTGPVRTPGTGSLYTTLVNRVIEHHNVDVHGAAYRAGAALSAHAALVLATTAFAAR